MVGQDSGYYVVGLIDDDPRKRHLRIQGVRVRGTVADLDKFMEQLDIQVLVVAIAKVTASQLRDLDKRCRAHGVQLRVIPSPVDIVRGAVRLSDVSEVTEEDLLGRNPVSTDETAIAAMLRGKRVLITGAGGSIGSELARQVNSYDPAYLGLLDRDESALHALHLSMFGKAMLDTDDLLLADIRDPAAHARRDAPGTPGRRLPRRRAEAPADAGSRAVGGVQDQRPGHPQRPGGRLQGRRPGVREHLHRQGRRPGQRPGSLQAHHRTPHRRYPPPVRGPLPVRAFRQRPRLPRLDADRVPLPDRQRRACHRHPPRRDALLHDDPRGRAPGSAGSDPGPGLRDARSSTWASRSGSRMSPGT